MTTTLLTKSLILGHNQCAKRAWLEFQGVAMPRITLGNQATMDQGQAAHQCARTLFPGAVVISNQLLLADAAIATQNEIARGADTIINAAFVSGDVGVRVDVLKKAASGYRIIEIKSASSVKDTYIDDCAIQLACVSATGVQVEGVDVMHPSTKITRSVDGNGSEVFVTANLTDTLLSPVVVRSAKVVKWVTDCRTTLIGKAPSCAPSEHCTSPHSCPYIDYCGKPVGNPDPDLVAYLPSKAGAVKALIAAGITRISDMPRSAMVHSRNALVYEAIVQNRAIIRADVADFIRALPFPRSYVDFEAVSFAVPRFAGMRSYEALPFQWSCHRQAACGAALEHTEFLDVTGGDPRRGFVESLLVAVGNSGPILVFSAYEKTRLKELALVFPDLSGQIMGLVDRIVDLLPIARAGYYHPAMLGSWSLKNISPTLPPCADLKAYADMGELADGLAAQGAYMNQIDPNVIGEQKEVQRQKMLVYCGADTRGLVHFVDCMEGACTPVSQARADIVAMA